MYFFGATGATTVLAAGPTYRLVNVNQLWSDEEFTRRKVSRRDALENRFPKLPEAGRAEMEAMLSEAVGDVVYEVAAVDRRFYVRTGTELICIETKVQE